jgi:putative redox protein
MATLDRTRTLTMTAPADGALVAAAHARCDARYAVEATARQHRVAADEPEAAGGVDSAATPLELLATALAACTAITLRMYAERKGWELGSIRVDCRVFAQGEGHRLERTVRCSGALDDARRARLLEIVEKTPVTKVVRQGALVATRFV